MILCVDGGSTKTIAVVFDERKLDITGVGLSGSANYTTNSPIIAKKEIKDSITDALKQAKLTINDMDRRVIAVVGIGDSEESTKVGNAILREIVGDNFEVMNDGKSAYYLGNLENNGFVFAPGTGSVGYIKRSEIMERVGGWGWMLGDFSSATWIVKKGIEAAMFENDSGEDQQFISQTIKTYFGNDVRELVWKVETRNIQKNILAGFAVILSELAKKGYTPALNIYKQSAEYITFLGNRVMEKFDSYGQMALVGGTMLSGDFYINMLRNGLRRKFQTYYGYQVVLGSLMGKLNILTQDIRDELIKQLDYSLFMLPEDKLMTYLKISSPPIK
jgi:N-acetylglucosamine kinase